jgi:hypothetical protein
MAKGNMIEFYSKEEQQITLWIEALKLSVILLDFKDELQLSKLLGRGNFARVHLCSRASDNTKFFALKTMEKAMIKKNSRSIVS